MIIKKRRYHNDVVILTKKKKRHHYVGYVPSSSSVIVHRSRPGFTVTRESGTSVSTRARLRENTSIHSGNSSAGAGVSSNVQGHASTNQSSFGSSRQNNAASTGQRSSAATNQSARSGTQQAVTGSEDAVALFEQYARSGANADLKAWALKTLPHLKDHLAMAKASS